MKNHITALCSALVIAGLTVSAQAPQPSPAQPQPTATRPQTPPDRSGTRAGDTVTVTGCITTGDKSMSAGRAAEAPGRDVSGAKKSDTASRYMLTSVKHASAGTQASDQNLADHHMSYALTTENSTVDFSKHLNHKVELTGTLDETTGRSPQAASTGTSGSTGTATVGRDANAMRMPPATLMVTSLKMVSATCP